jgi:hypothetical protein
MRSNITVRGAKVSAFGAADLQMMARRQFNISLAVAVIVMLVVAALGVLSTHATRVAAAAPHKFVMIVAPAPTTAVSANEAPAGRRS